jgi:hypothetical protein
MMESWEYGAENMLAHFRAVFNGSAPFALDVNDEETKLALKLDDTALQYLRRMQELLPGRSLLQRLQC